MAKEMITSIPVGPDVVSEPHLADVPNVIREVPFVLAHPPAPRQLGAKAVDLIRSIPFKGGEGAIEPGRCVTDAAERIVLIEDQASVRINPERVPGTDAYAAKQERIATDLRSNKLY